jgi:hypothetical protein
MGARVVHEWSNMKWLILASLLAATPHKPAPTGPATYFVRSDGGSSTQCDGKHDAAFSKNAKHACAWRHPFDAFPPGGPARIAGGDTVIVAAGSYPMGLGAPDAQSDKCRSDWPWDCHMTPIPSGPSPDKPTRVLGAGWDNGCAAPPELWGTERAETVIDLRGSSNVQLACFDITDHSGCVEFHASKHGIDRCERDKEPYGPWAGVGLSAADSGNVSLSDVNIHGLAHDGVRAGRLHDWTVERVHIVANGWSGWNGDIEDNNSSNSGRMIFRDVQIAWNGCGEKYPEKQPFGCWGQEEGGYGDGLGTGETSGDWLFERVQVDHNTQDGLDLLHARADAKVTFRQVHSEANAGNQLKASGSVDVEKSVLIGTCSALSGKIEPSDLCRAQGNALSMHPSESASVKVIGNQISGEGDCLIDMECGGGGCSGVTGLIQDNQMTGLVRKDMQNAKTTCSVWVEPALRGANLRFIGNRLRDVRSTGCPAGIKQCSEIP